MAVFSYELPTSTVPEPTYIISAVLHSCVAEDLPVKILTVLDSIPAFSDTVESEGGTGSSVE
jgi:hypothetical protein